MTKPVAALAMQPELLGRLFDDNALARLVSLAQIDPRQTLTTFADARAKEMLARVDVLITGWMCPVLDEETLAAAPNLCVVLHSGGSIKGHLTDAVWDRGIQVSSAVAANALPVAEYTVAAILNAGKSVPWIERAYRTRQAAVTLLTEYPGIGNYGNRVGIIGASRVGRRVLDLLRPFDVDVVVHDPYLDAEEAAQLGATWLDLNDLVRTSDLVSVHAPATPETYHQLDRRRLSLLRDGATVINTARASLIDQAALVEELCSGRINAVLDVTDPEVLPAGHPLYTLPNVTLTPHLAGSMGTELHRLGDHVVAELERYTRGLPLQDPVDPNVVARLA